MKKTTFQAIMRHALVLFFMLAPLQLFAQKNLREGYVITLKGDTLYGVIDFRLASMNSKRCIFKKDGDTEFKTYLPGEIDSYRFTNNGIYYVSKEIETPDEGRKKVFVEYVLRGNMNLYQIGESDMLLEDEEGNMKQFSIEKATNATNVRELHEEMDDVLDLLKKSPTATSILFYKTKCRDNTKAAVLAYVNEACPDGHCEAFEYKKKKSPKEDYIVHPWVKVGYKLTQYKVAVLNESLTGSAPLVSIGADAHLDRFIRGLMFSIGVSFEPGRASCETSNLFQGVDGIHLNGEKMVKCNFNQFQIVLGPGYRFDTGKLKTRVKVGAAVPFASRKFDLETFGYYYRGSGYENTYKVENNWKFFSQYGWYAGIGVEYPMKKFALVCDLEYIHNRNERHLGTLNTLYDQYDVLNQNAVSLSVGVKF